MNINAYLIYTKIKTFLQFGTTALSVALKNGQVESAPLLLENGADWSFFNRVRVDCFRCFHGFLIHEAHSNYKQNGTTPLYEAVQRGYFDLVQKFLSVSKPESVCQIKVYMSACI